VIRVGARAMQTQVKALGFEILGKQKVSKKFHISYKYDNLIVNVSLGWLFRKKASYFIRFNF